MTFPWRGAGAAGLLVAALACLSPARAADLWVNPGSMGPNALPVQPGERPWIEPELRVRLEATGQWTDRGDRSFVPAFRIEAPFGRWASMVSEGRPVELWRVSARTREAWALSKDSGTTPGDLLFGVKFLVFDGGRRFPSVAIRNLTKTTTGKDFYLRRFTNAPAYLLDALFAQRIAGPFGGDVEAWASAGFLAWQQGRNGQNDAFQWSGTLAWRRASGTLVRVEARGYSGWQAFDEPVVITGAAEVALGSHLLVTATLNAGLRDAPRLDAHLGIVLRTPALVPRAIDDDAGD